MFGYSMMESLSNVNYTLNKKDDLGKDPLLLDPILEYYEKDMQYLGYGLDKTNWKLTF